MKNYSHLVYKQLKINKRRNIYTIIGIMIGIILFITISELNIFMNEVYLQRAKENSGDYEAYITKLSKEEIKLLKGNVEIKNMAFGALDYSTKINIGALEKNMDIYALDSSCMEDIFNKSIHLVKGKLPSASNEIIIETVLKDQLNKNIGDSISIGKYNYNIVGFYDKENFTSNILEGITYFNGTNTYENVFTFINVKDTKNKAQTIMEIANKIGINKNEDINNRVHINGSLLNEYGYVVPEAGIVNGRIEGNITIVVMIAIIILLIYTSINVSIKERIKYFGMLRCIGATPDKIRLLILKESCILGVLSIIPGLIIGHCVAWIVINIGLGKIAEMNFHGVIFRIYWNVIMFTFLLIVLATLISSIVPVIKSGNISPIDGIKTGEGPVTSDKLRKSKVIRRLFGYKGELAYKNIRANNKSFIITTVVLIVTLVSFVMFTGYIWTTLGEAEYQKLHEKNFQINLSTPYDYNNINKSPEEIIESDFNILNDSVKFIKDTGNTNDIFSYLKLNINSLFKDEYLEESINENGVIKSWYSIEGQLFIYDENTLKKILPYIEGENVSLESFNKEGAIVIKTPTNNKINSEKIEEATRKLSSVLKMKIIGTIDSKYLPYANNNQFNGIFIIASKEFYENNKKILLENDEFINSSGEIYFNFLDLSRREETIENIEKYITKYNGWLNDNYWSSEQSVRYLIGTSIVFYTILSLVVLIGGINIINNRNISVSLRKREFGTLLALGMDRRDLKKIILLEGIVQCTIVALIGSIISYIGLKALDLILRFSGKVSKISGINSLCIIGGGLILILSITLISSIVPLRRFKQLDTMEMMKNEE